MNDFWRNHRSDNNEALLKALDLGNIIVKNDRVYNRAGKPFFIRRNFWGYPSTTVKINGKTHSFYLHKIIWVAANGLVPFGFQIDHIDKDPRNYKLSNLRLLSIEENRERVNISEPAF